MNECIATVRVPSKLKEEAENLVKEGYFKNLSDILVAGLRNEISEYSPSKAQREIAAFRRETWQSFLKKANGDYEKAAKLYDKAIEKSWEESELKKIVDAKNRYL